MTAYLGFWSKSAFTPTPMEPNGGKATNGSQPTPPKGRPPRDGPENIRIFILIISAIISV